MPYSVLVLDMFHYGDPEEETLVEGFTTLEQAREYARRRTRDSVEDQRHQYPAADAEELRKLWFMFGEDCLVVGGAYAGFSELDYFITHPASRAERNWADLVPGPDKSRLT